MNLSTELKKLFDLLEADPRMSGAQSLICTVEGRIQVITRFGAPSFPSVDSLLDWLAHPPKPDASAREATQDTRPKTQDSPANAS